MLSAVFLLSLNTVIEAHSRAPYLKVRALDATKDTVPRERSSLFCSLQMLLI